MAQNSRFLKQTANGGILLLAENLPDRATQPIRNLLDGGKGYILLSEFHPLNRRIGNSKFPAELQQSQIPPLLPNESSHVFSEISCHRSKTAQIVVPHMGFLGFFLLLSRMKASTVNTHLSVYEKIRHKNRVGKDILSSSPFRVLFHLRKQSMGRNSYFRLHGKFSLVGCSRWSNERDI